ncbi:MAG: tetratricopeptide repeat protein, partial [Alphaproteobacteria bacterium]|nr:tetratricopeptide repeat protein [Alphaproteobacteria bacterium]
DDENKAVSDMLDLSKKYPHEALVWYNLAWLSHNSGNYTQAIEYSQTALSLHSKSDVIRYLIGLCYLRLNQEVKAQEIFYEAEEINPDNVEVKLCLADILSRNNNFDEAEKRYKRLMDIDDKNYQVYANYAEMLYRQKRVLEAMDIYRKAVILFPSSADISNNLGALLRDLEEYDEALGLFFNALSLNPNLIEASINIWETLVLLSGKDEQKAKDIAKNWYKSYPDNQFAQYAVAALRGENVASNKIFTEKLFDNFADNYEVVMQNLDYSAPLAIRRITGSLVGRIADLGCGSGLVGVAVKEAGNYLIGVDISSKMLEKASEKKLYDELIKSDIVEFLKSRDDFEWIIAADVLGYIGQLDEFISLCRGKNIIFSIEIEKSNEDFKLQNTGRFTHNPKYVEKLLIKNGFCDIYKEKFELRTENFVPVESMIFKAYGDI